MKCLLLMNMEPLSNAEFRVNDHCCIHTSVKISTNYTYDDIVCYLRKKGIIAYSIHIPMLLNHAFIVVVCF